MELRGKIYEPEAWLSLGLQPQGTSEQYHLVAFLVPRWQLVGEILMGCEAQDQDFGGPLESASAELNRVVGVVSKKKGEN